jgi:type IV secretion system protein VirB9
MPFVSFIYPQDLKTQWAQVVQSRQVNTLPGTQEYLGNLDFHYAISGSASWKPIRVYNDGVKTIIQMPSTLSQSEAPVLLVVRPGGGLLTPTQSAMVNYRVQDDRYIVDSVFSKAILIAGVGSNQEKITITRES